MGPTADRFQRRMQIGHVVRIHKFDTVNVMIPPVGAGWR
jgi:hypothetical protein